MNEKIEDYPGILSRVDLSEPQMELFLEYMEKLKSNTDLRILYGIFYIKDTFKFLDLFAGRSIKVPKRREIYKVSNYIRIYSFIKSRGYNELSVYDASKRFNKRVSSIIRIYNKVEEILSSSTENIYYEGEGYDE